MLDHCETWYCPGIHTILNNETGAASLPPHAWMVPVVEDMLCHGRTGLTEAVLTRPRKAILFYGRWSLEEGLSLGEVRDSAFKLTGAGTWVGKLAHLAVGTSTLQDGW